jgi:predicted ATPase/class 3 adenylate cyclase
MNCFRCQAENREEARFCRECGALFGAVCPSCGAKVEAGSKFCDNCGTPLATTPTPISEPLQLAKAETLTAADATEVVPTSNRPTEAERRQLTVMFCDLVGSTELAGRLDPEVLRDVVRSYQQACDAVIGQLHGHVAQYLGDGLLVYFGYPVAQEDDPRRAVRAGLGIIKAIAMLNTRLQRERGVTLAARVGIHTGPVVIGEIGSASRREALALGEPPNVAARLQALAEPDTIVISGATRRLLPASITVTDLGAHLVKGLPAPLRVYRVLGDRGVTTSVEMSAAQTLTPLVGRDQEVGLLLDRWEHVKDGRGHTVLLSGEPGIGKSRLTRVLKDHIAAERCFRWECRCSPYHQDSALYPLIDLFERTLQFDRDDAPPERLTKLEAGLVRYGLARPEAVSLWAALLSVRVPDQHPPLNLTPQRQKEKTFEAIVALLLAVAAEQPLLFIVEDLHWGDPSTLEFVDFVFGQVPAASILMLMTSRPEFRPPWAQRSHLTYLTINRVTRKQTELMVERVAGGKPLPPEVLQHIVAKTDGVPLFVEELTRMVLESDLLRDQGDRYELTGALPPLAIPSTLQDSLMARLDRLATAKDVAQVGAALGRTFHYELLRAIASTDDATLQRALAKLGESDLLHQRGVPPDAIYIFKHALIQETAYQSMLVSRRQQLHRKIADTLVERFPETGGTQPELVAQHYTEAGLTEQAIPYWQRAGERALQRSADLEAISHLTRGLEMLTTLPESRERAHRELSLQITLGPAVMNTGMWSSGRTSTGSPQATPGAAARHTLGQAVPDVEHVYVRACELARQLEDTRQLFAALWGLYYLHQVRGQLQRAREVGEELLALAQQLSDPELVVVAHRALGNSLFWRGELGLVHTHAKHALALYDPQQMRAHAARYGQDAGVSCRSFGGLTLWLLGYPHQAREWIAEALTQAQTLRHAYTLSQALLYSALLHLMRGEPVVAQERAEAQRTLCTEHGFVTYLAWGTVEWGSALAARGSWAEGLAQMREGLAAYLSRARLPWLLFLGLLAEACVKAGQVDEGLRVLDEAWEAMQVTEERVYEAELYRLKGELLLQQSVEQQNEAEASFQHALDVARRQGARSLELRAAMSWSRVLQQQGKREEARRLLAEVYAWFTEGFDTVDLKDARALLDSLATGPAPA